MTLNLIETFKTSIYSPKHTTNTKKTTVVFTSRGMHVNYSVGNTEVLLQFDGTGAAAARDGLNAGTLKVPADNLTFGRLDTGITEQYKHLGFVNTGPHKYDQYVKSRVGHAQATNKALRKHVWQQRFAIKRQAHSQESHNLFKINLPFSSLGHPDI